MNEDDIVIEQNVYMFEGKYVSPDAYAINNWLIKLNIEAKNLKDKANDDDLFALIKYNGIHAAITRVCVLLNAGYPFVKNGVFVPYV